MSKEGAEAARPTAIDVACEFLRLAQQEPDEPELLSPMRLQKLVHYAQGWALAFHESSLFVGRIEAWKHGPVAPELYPLTKGCENGPIPPGRASMGAPLSKKASDLVEWVWRKYRGHSASKLRAMTHREAPWLEARAASRRTSRATS